MNQYIEKRAIPNQLKFSWLPARKLGNAYSSLESARAKCKLAQYLSDLSATEELHLTKSNENCVSKNKNYKSKRISSTSTLKSTGSYPNFQLNL
ncbi:Uncharacterized protein FWK35_00011029 [Aphis craccivora]|uniref:Uncharacterized protein n=1 Tax=Aphis craccivora TaxID=307492 RepID=A0A6G0YRC8_APHCR|nr:Uncharacterized protein FWK35_00011029 [Aphis craccivora]